MKPFIFITILLALVGCKKNNENSTPPNNSSPLKIDSTHLNLGWNKNSIDSFNIVYSNSWKIFIDPSTVTWFDINTTSGTGNKKIYVTVQEDNLSTGNKTAKIIIVPDGDTSKAIKIGVRQGYSFSYLTKLYGGTAKDEFHAVTKYLFIGYAVVGKSASNDGDLAGSHGGNTDVWVTGYDQNDNLIWKKTYGGFDADGGNSIINTNDGGYIIAGFETYGGDSVTNDHGQGDGWLIKLDDFGNKVWEKAIGGSSLDEATAIVQTSDGGYVVVGNTLSNDGDASGNHGSFDAWVLRLDKNGNILWAKDFGGAEADYFNSVALTTDGGFLLVGETSSNDGDVIGNHGSKDGWVVKIDGNGNKIWQKTLGGSDFEILRSVVTSGNDFLLAGVADSNDGDVTGAHGIGDGWIIKLSNSGDILWQKTYGGSFDDQFFSINSAPDNAFVATGISRSNDGDVSGNFGYYDEWVVKIDENGILKWQQSIGGSSDDFSLGVIFRSDKKFRIVGYTSSNDNDMTGSHGNVDGFISVLQDK